MNPLRAIDWIALVLVVVGGLNWGLVAVANIDLVAALFDDLSVVPRLVYALVGLSAAYLGTIAPKLSRT